MTLASVSERYGKDYWVEAAVALKERLGTPVGYHVYNWHEIPFNFSESNAEAYVGSFDGLLTWVLTLMPRSVEIVEYGAQGR